jgi:hypothetical protein
MGQHYHADCSGDDGIHFTLNERIFLTAFLAGRDEHA